MNQITNFNKIGMNSTWSINYELCMTISLSTGVQIKKMNIQDKSNRREEWHNSFKNRPLGLKLYMVNDWPSIVSRQPTIGHSHTWPQWAKINRSIEFEIISWVFFQNLDPIWVYYGTCSNDLTTNGLDLLCENLSFE